MERLVKGLWWLDGEIGWLWFLGRGELEDAGDLVCYEGLFFLYADAVNYPESALALGVVHV